MALRPIRPGDAVALRNIRPGDVVVLRQMEFPVMAAVGVALSIDNIVLMFGIALADRGMSSFGSNLRCSCGSDAFRGGYNDG